MIELLMVIMIIAVLGSVALSQFLDFRNEAKVAALRYGLSTMRVGLKNAKQLMILRCNAPSSAVPWATPFYNKVPVGGGFNDFRDPVTGVSGKCNFSPPVTAWNGPSGTGLPMKFLPSPFITSATGGNFMGTVMGNCSDGVCGCNDLPITNLYPYYYNGSTGEIIVGTNTNGLQECDL